MLPPERGGAIVGRDWRLAGIELALHEVMAEPIVHLVMRRDHLTADDVWAVIEEARRRHRPGEPEASAGSSVRLAADEKNEDAPQSTV